MQSIWILVFTFITIGHAFVDFGAANAIVYEDYNEPKNDDGFTKRATASDRLAAIPRSGLMISGRGWMPGFVDSPRVFKRSLPLEKIILRPVPIA